MSDPVGTRGHTGHCLEAHDLAASKLAAYREKDRDFVRILLVEGLVDPGTLRARIRGLPLVADHRRKLEDWLARTEGELG